MQAAPELIHRARPLLGTFVEITADGPARAFERAFAAVLKVQRLMSYHDPESELSRLNRDAAREPVTVSAWTYDILRDAAALAEESGGAFDPTIAPTLCELGFLPSTPGAPRANGHATWRDIELLPRRRVRFRRALRLDLGGIAKGFAVDRAIDVLRQEGCNTALVNAGGDLRTSGPRDWPIAIRHNEQPGANGCILTLRDAALATSAGYFAQRKRRGCIVTALVDGRTRQPVNVKLSVSVIAPTALLADSLTKVVLTLGTEADSILVNHGASAMVLDDSGFQTIPTLAHAA